MEFLKYQHVERFGTPETNGIENGMCYVFPKIDGTNAQLWWDNDIYGGRLLAGSRNRQLELDNDNAGFYDWACNQDRHFDFFRKYPNLRLYGEWLCLSGDTKIRLVSGGKRGHTMTIEEMYKYQETPIIEKSIYVKKDGTTSESIRPSWWNRYGHPQCFSLFLNEDIIKPQRIAKIIKTGKKEVYEVKTRNGYCIKSTLEHKFYTNNGWKSLKDLSTNDVVATSELYNHRIKRRYGKGSNKLKQIFKELRDNNCCGNCGSISSLEVHHIDENWDNNNNENLKVLCRECHLKSHSNVTAVNQSFSYNFDKIISIKHIGIEECYDISMGANENSSSFVANGFVVHNCPHSLKTYKENAWRNFYVFDVMDGENYLPYEEYKELLEPFGIEYIPAICKVENPTYERLIAQLEKNGYLIDDGKGIGEGIVIKNYNYKNKFGRQTWAKIVTNEFKAKHQKCQVTEIKESKIIEEEICKKYVTKSLIEKEKSKIENENNGDWSSKFIPRLINTVFYCLVKEESWNFVKEFKFPQVDFKRLQFFCTQQIKEQIPSLF